MNRFLKKILFAFLAFFLVGLSFIIVSSKIVDSRNFLQHETYSNLLPLKRNSSYDIAFMGPSHARLFSSNGNHERVEKILQRKILNLGKGDNRCGIGEQLFYLNYAYSQNIAIDTILFMVSPAYLLTEKINRASDTFVDEPFDLDFFWQNLFFSSENKYERLFFYIQSKFSMQWLNHFPDSSHSDTITVRKSYLTYWADKLSKEPIKTEERKNFIQSCNKLNRLVTTAQNHGTQVIFIVPTVLFDRPGHSETIAFLEAVKKEYGIEYYDFSRTIDDIQMFGNLGHLNTRGVTHFSEKYLKPILNPEEDIHTLD